VARALLDIMACYGIPVKFLAMSLLKALAIGGMAFAYKVRQELWINRKARAVSTVTLDPSNTFFWHNDFSGRKVVTTAHTLSASTNCLRCCLTALYNLEPACVAFGALHQKSNFGCVASKRPQTSSHAGMHSSWGLCLMTLHLPGPETTVTHSSIKSGTCMFKNLQYAPN